MIVKSKNGVQYFQFSLFSRFPEISHGLFTRRGGVSQGDFSSLNVGFSSGDNRERVNQNREKVLELTGAEKMVAVNQVHGTDLFLYTDPGNCGEFVEADAMITNLPGAALMIQTADCQPVMLYDPVKKVIANIHSGWRGSIQNIIGRTIQAMSREFGCDPIGMVGGVGPSLGPCCAEFVNYKKELPEKFWSYKDEKECFDFWAVSEAQLQEAGLKKENICLGRMCTKCNPDLFFSYRRYKVTGRLASAICIR